MSLRFGLWFVLVLGFGFVFWWGVAWWVSWSELRLVGFVMYSVLSGFGSLVSWGGSLHAGYCASVVGYVGCVFGALCGVYGCGLCCRVFEVVVAGW